MKRTTRSALCAARRAVVTAVAAAAALATQQAQAGLVYNWVTSALSPTITAVEGRIELSATLWPGGTLAVAGPEAQQQMLYYGCRGSPYVFTNGSYAPECTALVGVENFHFNVNNRPTDAGIFDSSLKMRALLTVDGQSPLLGSLYAESAEATNLLVRSAPGTADWSVQFFQSDQFAGGGNGCYSPPYCSGATGRWVLDPNSIPVPEPGTLALALAGFALAGSAAGRRKALQQRALEPVTVTPS